MEAHRFPFVHTLRVRYSEIDGQKIVYNAHYLTYLDLAITEYFRNIGIAFVEAKEFDIALVKATLEYKRPARLDDWLDIHVSVPRLGNSSFTGRFRISPHDRPGADDAHLEAENVYVSVTEEGRSRPIPGWVRERIAAVQRTADGTETGRHGDAEDDREQTRR
jgi:acyl-CoA thioester hydrolase